CDGALRAYAEKVGNLLCHLRVAPVS
ncbi:hypothetical protein A2U01_0097790, partial [Trifolium medium]|nr:hypothetical protein [Trifolium medium]